MAYDGAGTLGAVASAVADAAGRPPFCSAATKDGLTAMLEMVAARLLAAVLEVAVTANATVTPLVA